ncbi:unnamed protein product, partial [Ilex paraguariensis]
TQTLAQVYHTAHDVVSGEPDMGRYQAVIRQMEELRYRCLSALFEHGRLVQPPGASQQPVVVAPVLARQRG